MRTTSLGIENICAPCCCRCRHCLLSYSGRCGGVAYERGKALAERLIGETNIPAYYYVGHSMEFPQLREHIGFSLKHMPHNRVLQFNGMAFRDDRELDELLRMVQAEGIEGLDLTFYGTGENHDSFAGRWGDYNYLLRIMDGAMDVGLKIQVGSVITMDSIGDQGELFSLFDRKGIERRFSILPHAKGRGWDLSDRRITDL